MLPVELLNVVCGALSRDDLDALMLANALFRDIILRDFANGPFRYFKTVCARGHHGYSFVPTKGSKYFCEDNDDFGRRMRFGRAGCLW